MNTTSVKIKFRESTVDGKESTLYYQVIHNRMVRQIETDYHLCSDEWREYEGNIVLGKGNTNERKDYLRELAERIRSDRLRFARIVSDFAVEECLLVGSEMMCIYSVMPLLQFLW